MPPKLFGERLELPLERRMTFLFRTAASAVTWAHSVTVFLAWLWPGLLGICLIASLVPFGGSLIMITIFDFDNAGFFSALFLFTFVLLMLPAVAAFARDAVRGPSIRQGEMRPMQGSRS